MIIQHSIFEPNPNGHGGNRRTAQISEMLESIGTEVLVAGHNSPGRNSSFWQLFWAASLGVIALIRHPRVLFACPTISTVVRLGYFNSEFRNILKGRDPKKATLVWESTIPAMFPVVRQLAKKGVSVVAFPHNIESLSEALSLGNHNRSQMARWLSYELQTLSLAKKIICISSYDSWFYSNWGLAASTWHYEVVGENAGKISAIRLARTDSVKDTLLILGTSNNEATKNGIHVLLDASAKGHQTTRVAVVSAGFSLYPGESYPGVDIFPNLPEPQFYGELIRAEAIMVFQKWGTGQLTRIHEAHQMGIPVFGNELSARNYAMRSDLVPEKIRKAFPGLEIFSILPSHADHETRTRELCAFLFEQGNDSKQNPK